MKANGRPKNPEWDWLRPSIRERIGRDNGRPLTAVCDTLGIPKARPTIQHWLYGRRQPIPMKDANGNPMRDANGKPQRTWAIGPIHDRGLPDAIGLALCRWLRDIDRTEAQQLGRTLWRRIMDESLSLPGDDDDLLEHPLEPAAIILAPYCDACEEQRHRFPITLED
jgi:hypothetical protein